MSGLQSRIVEKMGEKKKLDEASVNNLAYAARQLNDMEQLERGLPTSRVEVDGIIELEQELAALEVRLRAEQELT